MSGGERIERDEILKGDLIRWERGDDGDPDYAIEYRATDDGYFQSMGGQHYLLDRPKPAVVLPDAPTLGWLACGGEKPVLGSVHCAGDGARVNRLYFGHMSTVTSFTEAVAIPKAALDELRRRHAAGIEHPCGWVSNFFRAIDLRGGGEG